MLTQNIESVAQLKAELEPLVLGKFVKGSSCNCGCIQVGDGIATEIEPAGNQYPGQEIYWYLWCVKVQTQDDHYWIGLSEFIPTCELEALFQRYFEGQ